MQVCGGTSGWQEPSYASTVSDYEPYPEVTCDGQDNDCNGVADDNFGTGDTCVGLGECGVGVYVCSTTGGVVCSSLSNAVTETCDGLDNDCDGTADEDNVCVTYTYSYANDIQPLWSSNSAGGCTGCHGGSGGLSLSNNSYNNLNNGVRVIPGNATGSRLYQKLSGTSAGTRMPQGGGQFSSTELNMISTWINEGAPNN